MVEEGLRKGHRERTGHSSRVPVCSMCSFPYLRLIFLNFSLIFLTCDCVKFGVFGLSSALIVQSNSSISSSSMSLG